MKKRKSRTWIWLLLIVLALGGWGTYSYTHQEKKLPEVEVAMVEKRTLHARITESGSVQPTMEVPIAPDVSGEVVELHVKEGQQVRKGQLLAVIRPDNYKAALEQSQASVNSAQADYMQAQSQIVQTQTNISQDSTNVERLQKLNAEKIISDQELENAKLKLNLSKSQLEAAKYSTQASFYRLKSAEASLKQSQQNLNRTSIYASMDGTITKLNIEVGQRVVGTLQMAGTEIMKIADLSNMEVLVDISENEITHIGLGDSATIEIDALEEKRFNGRVTDIAYSATKSGLGTSDQVTSFQVKVRISPQSYQELMQGSIKPAAIPFRPGMSALVDIFTDKAEDVLSVPIHAVTLHREPKPKEAENPWAPPKTEEAPTKPVKKEKRQEIVFVYEGGKVKEFPVKIGIADDVFIEIKEGASLGAKVVTGPHTLLNKELEEGMEVKELEKK